MLCPKCGHEEVEDFVECPACGVLVDRARGPLERPPVAVASVLTAPDPPSTSRAGVNVGREASSGASGGRWPAESGRAVGFGVALALGVYAVPAARFVFSYLAIAAHEIGHTVVAWTMGYPAIPTLDLLEGGGVSIRYERSPALCVVMVAFSVGLAVLVRRTSWLLPAAVAATLHVLLLLSPLHDAVIVAAGHGAELALAGVALVRGLAGGGTLGERVAWVATGVFVLLLNVSFGLRLILDPVELERYAAARRGESGMDLARLADALGGGIDLFAALIVLAALMVPPAALLATRRH